MGGWIRNSIHRPQASSHTRTRDTSMQQVLGSLGSRCLTGGAGATCPPVVACQERDDGTDDHVVPEVTN